MFIVLLYFASVKHGEALISDTALYKHSHYNYYYIYNRLNYIYKLQTTLKTA